MGPRDHGRDQPGARWALVRERGRNQRRGYGTDGGPRGGHRGDRALLRGVATPALCHRADPRPLERRDPGCAGSVRPSRACQPSDPPPGTRLVGGGRPRACCSRSPAPLRDPQCLLGVQQPLPRRGHYRSGPDRTGPVGITGYASRVPPWPGNQRLGPPCSGHPDRGGGRPAPPERRPTAGI